MERIRSSKFRHWLISLFLIAGIFPSVLAAFSCEKIDDRIQFKSECLQMEAGAGHCAEMQDCTNGSNFSIIDTCCDSTSQVVTHVRNSGHDTSFDKILSLDGSQSPPTLPLNTFTIKINAAASFSQLFIFKPIEYSASDTYLQTQRFRV